MEDRIDRLERAERDLEKAEQQIERLRNALISLFDVLDDNGSIEYAHAEWIEARAALAATEEDK